jgi:hypothetical protein
MKIIQNNVHSRSSVKIPSGSLSRRHCGLLAARIPHGSWFVPVSYEDGDDCDLEIASCLIVQIYMYWLCDIFQLTSCPRPQAWQTRIALPTSLSEARTASIEVSGTYSRVLQKTQSTSISIISSRRGYCGTFPLALYSCLCFAIAFSITLCPVKIVELRTAL